MGTTAQVTAVNAIQVMQSDLTLIFDKSGILCKNYLFVIPYTHVITLVFGIIS